MSADRVVAVICVLAAGLGMSEAAAASQQPPQPKSGPGGSDYAHAGWRVSAGGSGFNAWYVFEPARPRPARTPLAIVMHGYYEFSGYRSMYELIRHTVRKGNVVIYPRWQTNIAVPCPGPFGIEPCMTSALNGIRGALSYLRGRPGRVQPRLGKTSYFGFSFGGIITANLANRYRQLHLPKPRAIFLDDPHDGGLDGFDEPAVDDSLAGIPRTVKLQCHSGAEGILSEPNKADGSCNSIFPSSGTSRGGTRTSSSRTRTRMAIPTSPPSTECAWGGRAGPTPTTGTSAGRSGTRCGAAPTWGDTAGTRWAIPAGIARTAGGATERPSLR